MADRLGEALLDLRTSDKGLTTGIAAAKKGAEGLGRSFDATAGKATGMGASMGVAARGAVGLGRANHLAAGGLGNLTAQFNDIGLMLAAGQNPLMLALQQGTQITQVIGPLGAAGAVKALGSAFMGMLNPVSLITIGSIAAGAAMIQWLFGAGEKTRTLQGDLGALEKSMSKYRDAAALANLTTAELIVRFGAASDEIRTTLALLEELARGDAQKGIDALAQSLSEVLGSGDGGERRAAAADFFDVNIFLAFSDAQRAARGEARELTAEFVNQRDALGQANGDLDAQIEIMGRLVAATQALAELKDGISEEESGLLKTMAEALLKMQEQRGEVEKTEDAEKRRLAAAMAYFASSRAAGNAAQAQGRDMLAGLEREGEIRRATLLYGRESVAVTRLETEAARDALEAKLATLDIAGSLKDEIRAAFQATTDADAATRAWVATMAGVKAEVAGVLSALASIGGDVIANAAKAVEIEALRAGKSVAEARSAATRHQIDAEFQAREAGAQNWFARAAAWTQREVDLNGLALDEELAAERANASAREAALKRGAGRDAVSDLVTSLDLELDMMREHDPVAREMIRLRGILAGATDAQRAEVEGLIEATIRERAAMEQAQETGAFFGDITLRSLDALIVKGESLEDVLANVASALASAALQAAILGTGPFATLFGSGPGTSLFGDGGLLSGLFAGGFATGGLIPSGQFGIVGEAGPEPIIGTSRGAMVLPNSSLRRVEGGGGTNVTVNIQTPDAQSFARSRGQVAAGIARAVAAGQRNL